MTYPPMSIPDLLIQLPSSSSSYDLFFFHPHHSGRVNVGPELPFFPSDRNIYIYLYIYTQSTGGNPVYLHNPIYRAMQTSQIRCTSEQQLTMIVGKGTGAIISRIPSYNTAPAEGAAIGRSDFVSGVLCRRRKKGLEEKATKKGKQKKNKRISTLSPLPSLAVGLHELSEEKGKKENIL